MTAPRRFRGVAAILALGLAAAAILQVRAIREQSLIGDAPYHLLAGHQALRYGENRLNLEHPPLVKLVAALPLLAEHPLAPNGDVLDVVDESHALFGDPALVRRVQVRARGLLFLVFGLPLLVASYGLGRHLGGSRVGVLLAVAMGLSFATLPFLSVIQTDAAVALGAVLTVWSALRFVEAPGRGRTAALGSALGLTLAAKFSGLLLIPTAAVAVVLARGLSVRRRLGSGLLVLAIAVLIPATTYRVANWSYDSDRGRETLEHYLQGRALLTDDRLQSWKDPILALETLSPGAAQYVVGALGIRAQNDLGVYPTHAFGELRSSGRWWYFPAVLLIRTPLLLLLATGGGLVVAFRRGRPEKGGRSTFLSPTGWIVGTTLVVYLGTAAGSSYNLGIRHLLPVLPLLYLPAARFAARNDLRTMVVVIGLVIESWCLAPLWMSATNLWWAGADDPARHLIVSGDTEYHQNFRALDAWAEAEGIDELGVLYPLLDPRELAAYSTRSRLVRPGDPLPSGWYVGSILLDTYLPAAVDAPTELRGRHALEELADRWRPTWNLVRSGEDHGSVAGTFHAYRLPPSAGGD